MAVIAATGRPVIAATLGDPVVRGDWRAVIGGDRRSVVVHRGWAVIGRTDDGGPVVDRGRRRAIIIA
jgi:hypothetical protein